MERRFYLFANLGFIIVEINRTNVNDVRNVSLGRAGLLVNIQRSF